MLLLIDFSVGILMIVISLLVLLLHVPRVIARIEAKHSLVRILNFAEG